MGRSCSYRVKSPQIKRNPFITVADETDYLSETIIEDQEADRRRKENMHKPEADKPMYYFYSHSPLVDVPGNVNDDSDDNILEPEDIHPNLPVNHGQLPVHGGQGSPENAGRNRVNTQIGNRPATAAGNAASSQVGGQRPANDDDLFNSGIFNNNNRGEAEDDIDFDFESSEGRVAHGSQGPNPQNFETNNRPPVVH